MSRPDHSQDRELPPAARHPPTLDRIRSDIDSGATGEKVRFPDPAAAPLGTDDEAAGTVATEEARALETRTRPPLVPAVRRRQGLYFFMAMAGGFALALVAAVFLAA